MVMIDQYLHDKTCDKSICKPLYPITLVFFPLEWKKANVIPVHQNGGKQCLKNYRSVSLLPI